MGAFKGLWVDDERPIPDDLVEAGWTSARSFHEAIVKLELIEFEEVSLDHDLGCFYGNKEMTGYDVIVWLVDRKLNTKEHVPSKVYVHSANPAGRDNIQAIIDKYFS